MSASDVARRYFESQTHGDIEGALDLFSQDAHFQGPFGEVPLPDGVRAYLQSFQDSFAGNGFEITNLIEQGDQVAVEGIWFGTHSGPLRLPDGSEIAPTNRTIRAPFATVIKVDADKITAHRGYWDMAGFMAQLEV